MAITPSKVTTQPDDTEQVLALETLVDKKVQEMLDANTIPMSENGMPIINLKIEQEFTLSQVRAVESRFIEAGWTGTHFRIKKDRHPDAPTVIEVHLTTHPADRYR